MVQRADFIVAIACVLCGPRRSLIYAYEWGFWVCWKLSAAVAIKPHCCRTPAVVSIFTDSAACVLSFYHSTPLHMLGLCYTFSTWHHTQSFLHGAVPRSHREPSIYIYIYIYIYIHARTHTYRRTRFYKSKVEELMNKTCGEGEEGIHSKTSKYEYLTGLSLLFCFSSSSFLSLFCF